MNVVIKPFAVMGERILNHKQEVKVPSFIVDAWLDMNKIETQLYPGKKVLKSIVEYSAKNLTEIWRQANLAESALAQIPITHTTLTNTQKFINQVGDYSYALSRKTIEDGKLTDDDFNNLSMLYSKCNELNKLLGELTANMGSKSISWDELKKEENNAFLAQEVSNISQDSFGNIEKGLQDYEGLIYDGPFSEHMTSQEPKGLGTQVFEANELEDKIYNFINKNAISEIDYEGEVEGTILAHRFNIKLKNGNNIIIDFTKIRRQIIMDEL